MLRSGLKRRKTTEFTISKAWFYVLAIFKLTRFMSAAHVWIRISGIKEWTELIITDSGERLCRRAAKWYSLGFQPQVGDNIFFCALKGRGMNNIYGINNTAPLQGATVISIHEPGVETPGYITWPLRGKNNNLSGLLLLPQIRYNKDYSLPQTRLGQHLQ